MRRFSGLALVLVLGFAFESEAGRKRQPVRVCNELAPYNGALSDATPVIESCIALTTLTGTAELPAGTYTLHSTVDLNRDVDVVGPGTGACSITDGTCATLKPHPTLFTASTGLFRVDVPGAAVLVQRIIFDGTKTTRSATSISQCQSGEANNSYGMNVLTYSDGVTFQYNVFKNALCGTGLLVAGSRNNYLIYQNWFADNGLHNQQNLWSDGLTVNELSNSVVAFNHFADNTDVDVIVGGCSHCSISVNTINHSGPAEKGSFAALMLYKWPNTSGVFNDTTIEDNAIECSVHECGFGIMVGPDPWYQSHLTANTGTQIRNNTVTAAQVGIIVDSASGFTFSGNSIVTNATGNVFTSCGSRTAREKVVSPDSSGITGLDGAVAENWNGCIANWWTQ